MPLYTIKTVSASSKILIWKIRESIEELRNEVILNEKNKFRLNGMKSILHQRGFLSVRKLLQIAGYTDLDLYYDEFGKPHLYDGTHISISHSHDFSTILLSDKNCGIDLEMQREKICRIADKFVDSEFHYLNQQDHADYVIRLTVIWGAKEAIFKIRNEAGISFRDHIWVAPFENKVGATTATLHFGNLRTDYQIYFENLENFTLVYTFENI